MSASAGKSSTACWEAEGATTSGRPVSPDRQSGESHGYQLRAYTRDAPSAVIVREACPREGMERTIRSTSVYQIESHGWRLLDAPPSRGMTSQGLLSSA
jgi:hypothetical protein